MLQTQINPYLVFKGNCNEAMNFYQECLGGELSIQTVKDSPMAEQWPVEVQENTLHATLINNQLILLASDMGEQNENFGSNTVFLSLTCSNEDETKIFSTKLSAGGTITRPLHEFFGGIIGALTDKFGINWLIYYNKN